MSGMENENNCYKNEMSSVEEFKSAIVRIRDILRVMSITGMDSMRTISIYLLAKNITVNKCRLLGIPEFLAWENIMNTSRNEEGGLQLALDYFYNKNNTDDDREYLLKYFDEIFGTQNFSFDVRDIKRHREIMEILDKLNLEHIDCHMDILGYVYEHHLKTGSSSASRDLGQFFTDRIICNYLVNLCSPKFISKGIPESMCDPAMGTGGFITSYIKYFNKLNKDINWNIQSTQIHGCDVDPRVAGLASINTFLESGGFSFKNIIQKDSLHEDLPLTGYDIILANMPFGIKGLKHADVCKRVNELRIIGTKSEPLFLQLMMVSLNKGGRCAVVVPDGVLINSSKLHDGTRKYLLDNFELHRVIKMDGTFFMNTSIKPSILFFEKTGKPTKNIEFWEISKNDKNEVIEKIIVGITRDQLDKSFTLDVRKFIKKEEEVVVNTEYEKVKLGDLLINEKFKKFNSGDMDNIGDIPFYNGSWENPVGTHSEFSFNSETPYYVFIKDGGGDHTSDKVGMGMFFRVKGKCAVGSHNIVFTLKDYSETLYKYVYFYTKLYIKDIRDTAKYSINLGSISINSILNFEIALPPLEIQQKIVETLNKIYSDKRVKIEDTIKYSSRIFELLLLSPDGSKLMPIIRTQLALVQSKEIISNIRERMTDIIRMSDVREFEKVKLEDVCKVDFGDRITQKKDTGTKYPVYGSGGETFRTDKFNRTGKTCKIGRFAISEPNMVMFVNGPYWLLDSGFTVSSSDFNKMTNEYLWFYLIINKNTLAELSRGSCQNNIIMDDFYNFEITLPPLELQKDIVRRLENYENQIKSLEESIRDADDNARFILDSYFKKNWRSAPIRQRLPLKEEFLKDISLESSENNSEVSVNSTNPKQQEEPECIVEPPPPKRKIIKKVNVKDIN